MSGSLAKCILIVKIVSRAGEFHWILLSRKISTFCQSSALAAHCENQTADVSTFTWCITRWRQWCVWQDRFQEVALHFLWPIKLTMGKIVFFSSRKPTHSNSVIELTASVLVSMEINRKRYFRRGKCIKSFVTSFYIKQSAVNWKRQVSALC